MGLKLTPLEAVPSVPDLSKAHRTGPPFVRFIQIINAFGIQEIGPVAWVNLDPAI